MSWLVRTLSTSVGKKFLMALTGLGFIGFLCAHLAGNLTIYAGEEAFNAYAEKLHSLGPLLTVFELGLLAFALLHVGTGLLLFLQNLKARPVGYSRKDREGGRTLSSITMPYTGLLILAFVFFHLSNFTFAERGSRKIFEIVSTAFQSPWHFAAYVAAMAVLAFHVRHGFWSLFQSLGGNHPQYMPLVMFLSLAAALVFGLGFGLIPLYMALSV